MITGLLITAISAATYAAGVILGGLMHRHDDDRKRRIAISVVGFCFFGVPLVPALSYAGIQFVSDFTLILPAMVSLIFAGITGPKAVGEMFPKKQPPP